MNNKGNKYIKQITLSAIIAALYAAVTLAIAPISYNSLQFRISEVLTILPCFTPMSVVGLTIGCFFANIFSPYGIVDMIFGTLATFLAAITTYLFRNIKIKKIPFLSLLSPVFFNAVIVGIEIAYAAKNVGAFPLAALEVAFGEAVVCFALGIPLYLILDARKDIFDKFR